MSERKLKAPKDNYPRPWEERPVSFERWQKHRARLMEHARPGRRPDEWWEYEKRMPQPESPGEEHIVLYEAGELDEAEIAALTPHWVDCYERTKDPNFSYCTGNGWLTGEEARRAMYEWAGIPPAILKKWDAARARRAKAIKPLEAGTPRPEDAA